MPSTYTLISSNVLSSAAASVTFSAIPSTYTDLVLRMSVRGANAAATSTALLRLNGLTANYSQIRLRGNGSTASSTIDSAASEWYLYNYPAATATTDTFGSIEVYVPNYAGTQNKAVSSFVAGETNAVTANLTVAAHLLSLTSAVTEMSITNNGGNFVSGSSFYLYGIKNS
jgi:ABC-type cobalamin transport system ATPase subunit